jgi:hypothetical protein
MTAATITGQIAGPILPRADGNRWR